MIRRSMDESEHIIDLNVLVVEDDIIALQWLESILNMRVKCVIGAKSAEEALSYYRQNAIDVVLTDLTLPGMSGIELIDRLYRDQRGYVIVMTGYDDTEVLQQLINRQITFFMHKPIELEQLFMVLSQVEITIKSQQELAIKEEMLRKQSIQASMGEMLSIIAHQWKQPLALINSIVAELRLDEKLHQNEEQLEQIEKQIIFLSDTIELFRNLFNPNKVPVPFSIDTLIQEALMLYRVPIESKHIAVMVDNGVEGSFYGYHDELFQVLLILISNAIDAFALNQREKWLSIRTWKKENDLHLFFEDNAGGMSAEVREKIFAPYFTTKQTGKGCGLGLYVAKMILEGRGWGMIDIQTLPNGSRFVLQLAHREGWTG